MPVEYRGRRRLESVALWLQEDPIVVPGFRGRKNLALPLPEYWAGRGMGRKPPSRAAMNPVQPSSGFRPRSLRLAQVMSTSGRRSRAGRWRPPLHGPTGPYWIRIISRLLACGGGALVGHSSAGKEVGYFPPRQAELTASGMGNWRPGDPVFLDIRTVSQVLRRSTSPLAAWGRCRPGRARAPGGDAGRLEVTELGRSARRQFCSAEQNISRTALI